MWWGSSPAAWGSDAGQFCRPVVTLNQATRSRLLGHVQGQPLPERHAAGSRAHRQPIAHTWASRSTRQSSHSLRPLCTACSSTRSSTPASSCSRSVTRKCFSRFTGCVAVHFDSLSLAGLKRFMVCSCRWGRVTPGAGSGPMRRGAHDTCIAVLAHPEQRRPRHRRRHHHHIHPRDQQRQVGHPAKAQGLPALLPQPGEHVLPAHLVVVGRVVDVLINQVVVPERHVNHYPFPWK